MLRLPMMATITNAQRFFAFTLRLQLDAIRRGVPLDDQATQQLYAEFAALAGLETDLDRLVLAVEALEGNECGPRRDLEHEEWLRIGQFDRARARSLWVRFTRLGPSHVSENGLVYEGPVVAVELCSGRDGGDEYVKITPGELAPPLFCNLFDTLHAQVWAQAVDGLDESQT